MKPEEVRSVLERDPEFRICRDASVEHFREYTFTFGNYTLKELMESEFSCQRCGSCCENKQCSEISEDGEKKLCHIYQSDDYPLACFSFPIGISELTRKNSGIYSEINNIYKYELGIVDGCLYVCVQNECLGWGGENH